jgi:hypothetical protein
MRTVVLRTVVILPLMGSTMVGAQQITVVPSVSVSAVSDDNVFTTTSTRSADRTTLLSPGIESALVMPRGSLLGSYSFDMQRSMTFEALNDLEARRHGMFEAHYRNTERLATAFRGHYDRAENAGELNFESAFLLPRRRASRWELAPSFAYQGSPLVTWRAQYNWVREDLERTMVANEHVGRFGLTREISERTAVSAGYLGRHFINGEDAQTSHAALVGWTRDLGPFTSLSVQAGPRFSSRGELAPEISVSLGRRAAAHMAYAIDYWQGESIILGVLGPVEVISGTARLAIPLRRNFELGAAGGLFSSDSQTQGDAHTYHGEGLASWSFHPMAAVAGSYSADFQRGDLRTSFLPGRSVTRHVFMVKLTVAPQFSRTLKPHGPLEPLAGPPQGVQP